MIDERVDYIHWNPVEEEIVDEPEYYWYSSARDYAGKKGLLEVELVWRWIGRHGTKGTRYAIAKRAPVKLLLQYFIANPIFWHSDTLPLNP